MSQMPAQDADIGPIRRLSLHDQVTTALRDMIIAGSLPPGSHIVEGEVGAKLGVSRTPLRESLKTLASEGLVDLIPARGAFVRSLTPDGVQSMLEVVTGLEAFAGRLACERATAAEIDEIARLHDDLERHYAARDRTRYVRTNLAIHAGIVALSQNPELIATHTQYSARSRRVRYAGNVSDAAWDAAVSEHREMISALRARDADRLAAVLRNHIRLVWDRIRSNF
jgi:DNA-binding GntR family transcriptional regulator